MDAYRLARQEHDRTACVGFPERGQPARDCDWCGTTHFPVDYERDPDAWEAEVP
jgi:hypothetical protein